MHGGLTTSLQSKAQASHLGRDKCYSTLQQCYSFPMMRDRIQMYIKYCDPCQKQNTHKLEKCAHILKPISVPQKCFSKVGLDLIGPLCESNQKKYIISCIDYFSKFVEAKAIENKTGVAVATFIYELICRYGVLDITITDQGK